MLQVLLRPPTQTRQDGGANSSTARRCVCLGRVTSGCSRCHTSTAHEETMLQRCGSASAVTVACLPHKTCSQTNLQSRRSWGLRPREDPRRKRILLRAEASFGLEKSFARAARRSTGPVSFRNLLSHSGLGKEQRDGPDGILVDKSLKNARVCTFRGIQT
jgi:hypothetical protein